MRFFLDTSFLIDYMRADLAALQRFRRFFEQGDRILVNEIVMCEVAPGLRRTNERTWKLFSVPSNSSNRERTQLCSLAIGGERRGRPV